MTCEPIKWSAVHSSHPLTSNKIVVLCERFVPVTMLEQAHTAEKYVPEYHKALHLLNGSNISHRFSYRNYMISVHCFLMHVFALDNLEGRDQS